MVRAIDPKKINQKSLRSNNHQPAKNGSRVTPANTSVVPKKPPMRNRIQCPIFLIA
jgi:hypothetical protein